MVLGRINKYYKEVCLIDQEFVKDPDQSVGKLLKANDAEVLAFTRFQLGEGIEKKQEDFCRRSYEPNQSVSIRFSTYLNLNIKPVFLGIQAFCCA